MARIDARLQKLPVQPVSLSDYEGVVPQGGLQQASDPAGGLGAARVLLISTAPPEPSDLSRSTAALLRGLGVEADRALLHGDAAFSRAGRELADGLAGADCKLPAKRWRELREASEAAALSFDTRAYDVVIVHGTGAIALVEGRRSDTAGWVWRTGRDLSKPTERAWAQVEPLLAGYSAISVAVPSFAPPGSRDDGMLRVTPGAFDPLAPAQRDPAPGVIPELVADAGIDLGRPIVSQAGRLDASADPLAVVLDEMRSFAAGEPALTIATDRNGVTDAQIGAIGRVSRCALPASLSDEFDPEVAAALWRGTPVLAEGEGARAQVRDGIDGYFVSGVEERATRVIQLNSDPRRGTEMARAGRRSAAENFSVTRLLGDELELIGDLAGRDANSSLERVGA